MAGHNLKEIFQINNDMNNIYNLRNRETDFMLSQRRKEFNKMRFSCNGAAH